MLKKRRPLKGRIDTFRLDSRVLAGNALGDPNVREVIVHVPPEHDRHPDRRLPLFVDLVGFMGAGPSHVNWKGFDENVPERIERLVRQKKMGPVVTVFPDCWTRLGGNQYVNSTAVGRYADHLTREVVPAVEARYRAGGGRELRAVFGKSSGGYGAMLHGMRHARHWGAVACHSGDMYFDFCYRTDIPNVLNVLAKSRRDPARFLRDFYGKDKATREDGHALMFLAMAATYDPDPDAPLGFHLPMDLHTGEVDERRWRRWLRHDPVQLVKRQAVQDNLRSLRGLFLDCGTRDQYHLQYGARILHARLGELGIAHRFEEFDDDHSGIDYRMDVSLPFLHRALSR